VAKTAAQKKKEADAAANLKASYGFVALLAQQVPEIGKLMQQAITGKWTSERFQMAVANTAWWKRTPAATRQWITQQAADPASAAQSLRSGGDSITQQASALGFEGISPQAAQKIWLTGQLRGYDETTMKAWTFNAIFKHGLAGDLSIAGGEIGARMADATQLASAYGYNPKDLKQQITMAVGESFSDSQDRTTGLVKFQDKLKGYAKSKYGAFADRIDQGETVMDIANPYFEKYSQILEVNPNDVSLDDKLIQQWLQGKSEAGKPPAATAVWQAEQDLRKDPRWGYTTNARQSAAETATVIGRAFGMVG